MISRRSTGEETTAMPATRRCAGEVEPVPLVARGGQRLTAADSPPRHPPNPKRTLVRLCLPTTQIGLCVSWIRLQRAESGMARWTSLAQRATPAENIRFEGRTPSASHHHTITSSLLHSRAPGQSGRASCSEMQVQLHHCLRHVTSRRVDGRRAPRSRLGKGPHF